MQEKYSLLGNDSLSKNTTGIGNDKPGLLWEEIREVDEELGEEGLEDAYGKLPDAVALYLQEIAKNPLLNFNTEKDTFLLAKILYHTVESNADKQAVNDVLDTSDVDESSITEEDKEKFLQRMKKLKSNQRDALIANRENTAASKLLMIISDLNSDVLDRLTRDESEIDRNPDSSEKKETRPGEYPL